MPHTAGAREEVYKSLVKEIRSLRGEVEDGQVDSIISTARSSQISSTDSLDSTTTEVFDMSQDSNFQKGENPILESDFV